MAPIEVETKFLGLTISRKSVSVGQEVEVSRVEKSTSVEVTNIEAVSETEANLTVQREWVGFGFKKPFATYRDSQTTRISSGAESKIKTRIPGITRIVRSK